MGNRNIYIIFLKDNLWSFKKIIQKKNCLFQDYLDLNIKTNHTLIYKIFVFLNFQIFIISFFLCMTQIKLLYKLLERNNKTQRLNFTSLTSFNIYTY